MSAVTGHADGGVDPEATAPRGWSRRPDPRRNVRKNLRELSRGLHGGVAERRRGRLLAVASAGLVSVLLAGADLLRLWLDGVDPALGGCAEVRSAACVWATDGLAAYVSEPGTRVGVALGAVLLGVPFAVFGVQVLRFGTAARQRRLAALSLAGATRHDLGRLAGSAAARSAGWGALTGLPGLLVLWVLLGVLPPAGSRLLPTPTLPVLACWPVIGAVVVAGAAASAAAAAHPATAEPLGQARRVRRPLGLGAAVPAVLSALAFLAGLFAVAGGLPDVLILLMPLSLVGAAVSLGPWLVLLIGRRAARSRRVEVLLAGRRLAAEPRTPGRVSGVLLAVGLAVGIACAGIGGLLDSFESGSFGQQITYYLGGYLLALGGIGFAAAVGAASLVVGAAEAVLDARRPTAALTAMGMSPGTVRAALRRQLWMVALVPSVSGSLVGWVLWVGGAVLPHVSTGVPWATLAGLACAVVVCTVAAGAGVGFAGLLLRGPLDEAMDPVNLRTA